MQQFSRLKVIFSFGRSIHKSKVPPQQQQQPTTASNDEAEVASQQPKKQKATKPSPSPSPSSTGDTSSSSSSKPSKGASNQEGKKKKSEEKSTGFHDFSYRRARDSPEIDDMFIAKCHFDIQKLPANALKRAQQVFSKYPHKDLREMGIDFMKMYQQLHAVEKPSDISSTELFANTEQLIGESGNLDNIVFLRGQTDTTEQMEDKITAKRKAKQERKREEEEAIKNGRDPSEVAEQAKEEEEGEEGKTSENSEFKSNSNNNIRMNLMDYSQNAATSYLLRKAPHTFSVACRILSEIRYRMPEFAPQTFLDFGAGVGSGCLAMHDVFPETKHIVACEPSKNMRQLGKHMTQDIPHQVYVDNLAQTISLPYAFEFDVVYIGHVLQEVPSVEARKLIVESLWSKVKPGGVMIFVENGTPKGFRFTHDFRRYILDDKKEDQPYIIAPCPHQGPCPLAAKADTWCHFDQRVAKYPKAIMSKLPTERQFDHEKYCYMVIQKGRRSTSAVIDEDLATTPAQRSFFWDRILFPIMKKSGHLIFDTCTHEGDFERRITAKSHGTTEYRAIKKLEWGDLWPFVKRIPNKFRKEGPRGPRLW